MSDDADALRMSEERAAALRLDEFGRADWETSADWWRMCCYLQARSAALRQAHGLDVNRKLRLVKAACDRHNWSVFGIDLRRGVILVEALADRLVGAAHHIPLTDRLARKNGSQIRGWPAGAAGMAVVSICTFGPDIGFEDAATLTGHPNDFDPTLCPAHLRDLVFDPFAPPPAFDEEWLYRNDAAVYLLAQAIYYDYRFDRLPELADALERAGCADPDILAHCRGGGPHVRGCWVVDGLLRPDVDPLKRLLRRPPVPGDRLAAYLMSDDPKDPFTLYRG
jgi:hypothetical protein